MNGRHRVAATSQCPGSAYTPRGLAPKGLASMQSNGNSRRAYGTGSLFLHRGKWYGQWRVGDRLVKRMIGPKRESGSRRGLTRTQAEAQLRRRMQVVRPPTSERLTVAEAGDRYLLHLEAVMGRKRATIMDYRLILDRQLAPYFGARPLDRIDAEQVTAFLGSQAKAGLARQTIINRLNLLGGIFRYAVKRGWASANPVAAVDRPKPDGTNPDIRFLDVSELEAVIRAVQDDRLGPMERVLYLIAAMTGLRQGELVALRWRDVDWTAGVIRVRRNYTHGMFGTPKSRRSSRAVPMAVRVAAELERHFQRAHYQGDDDLVFCHPDTGNPYDASKLRQRFKRAVKRACVREVRFHDLRHTFGTDGRGWGPDAEPAGVDGTRRPDHHPAVCGLLARSGSGRSLRRGGLRGGHQFGHQFERN
jgi:integrase